MFYDETQAINKCEEEPSLIFSLIDEEHKELVDKLLTEKTVDINTKNIEEYDVLSYMLKKNWYDLVLKHMKNKKWNVNHQNVEGDTFGHILACDNSVATLKIVEQLVKKKNYLPNIKNNKGETVLDKAINHNYICTAFKILEDKRFNNIDVSSFRKLCNACINNVYYGKYSKLNNLDVIVESLEKKELIPSMRELISRIIDHLDEIKNALVKKNGFATLEQIIDSSIEATA